MKHSREERDGLENKLKHFPCIFFLDLIFLRIQGLIDKKYMQVH